jgi:hypothetical protein
MRHDRHAIISGANPISTKEAACAHGPWSTPRAGAFARTGKFSNSSDGGSLADASRHYAHMGGWCVPNAAAVRFKKPATGFPARAPTFLR